VCVNETEHEGQIKNKNKRQNNYNGWGKQNVGAKHQLFLCYGQHSQKRKTSIFDECNLHLYSLYHLTHLRTHNLDHTYILSFLFVVPTCYPKTKLAQKQSFFGGYFLRGSAALVTYIPCRCLYMHE
jgi:hypothetical protein